MLNQLAQDILFHLEVHQHDNARQTAKSIQQPLPAVLEMFAALRTVGALERTPNDTDEDDPEFYWSVKVALPRPDITEVPA